MGCGKSTLGRSVAALTGWQFIDLDNYIEQRFHRTVKEIFAEYGEDGFRKRERAMLQEVADFENVIVACGGGTPCFFDNMEWMNRQGTTVFLDTNGTPICRQLQPGESIQVDENHIIALHSITERQMSSNWSLKNVFAGEGLSMLTITGPGQVYLSPGTFRVVEA